MGNVSFNFVAGLQVQAEKDGVNCASLAFILSLPLSFCLSLFFRHTLWFKNMPMALHKVTKQTAHRANCLICCAALWGYNTFKGPEAQTDEAEKIYHKHK
ncbi:hypothetical protein ILYODFUR_020800, partial [Ilyodon furcidens]